VDNQDRIKWQDNFFDRADRFFEGGNLGQVGQKLGQYDGGQDNRKNGTREFWPMSTRGRIVAD